MFEAGQTFKSICTRLIMRDKFSIFFEREQNVACHVDLIKIERAWIIEEDGDS